MRNYQLDLSHYSDELKEFVVGCVDNDQSMSYDADMLETELLAATYED